MKSHKISLSLSFSLRWTGLLELPRPIRVSKFIQPAKMSTVCEIPHMGEQNVIVAGMGKFKVDDNSNSGVLLQAELVTVDSESCTNLMKFKRTPETIICASTNLDTYKKTDLGDSGEYSTNDFRLTLQFVENAKNT